MPLVHLSFKSKIFCWLTETRSGRFGSWLTGEQAAKANRMNAVNLIFSFFFKLWLLFKWHVSMTTWAAHTTKKSRGYSKICQKRWINWATESDAWPDQNIALAAPKALRVFLARQYVLLSRHKSSRHFEWSRVDEQSQSSFILLMHYPTRLAPPFQTHFSTHL